MKPQCPLIATDILIEHYDGRKDGLVLITRRNPPYGLAVPGGFAELGLSLPENAVKEAREETSLEVLLEDPQTAPPRTLDGNGVGVRHGGLSCLFSAITPDDKLETHPFLIRSDPNRDKRGPVVSVAYLGRGYGRLKADDDAKSARIYTVGQLVDLLGKGRFAFDHETIVKCYLNYRSWFGPVTIRDAWSG